MKVSVIAAAATALLGFANAAPTPQDFGSTLAELPPPSVEPVTEKPVAEPDVAAEIESAVEDIQKRGAATDNFVKVFENWTGSTQTGGYITLKFLDTYSPDLCAEKCLASPSGCVFFNLYIEHNHTGDQIKCALYSIASTKNDATNFGGQVRNGVTTSKSQSAGWKKKNLQADIPGYTYECYGSASINAPRGLGTYMGVTYSTTSAEQCAAACEAKTAYNENQADPGETYRACNFFNFYNVYRDGVAYQNACTFYIVPWDASYATNVGQERNGHTYSIGESCGYTRNPLIGENGLGTKPGGVIEILEG